MATKIKDHQKPREETPSERFDRIAKEVFERQKRGRERRERQDKQPKSHGASRAS